MSTFHHSSPTPVEDINAVSYPGQDPKPRPVKVTAKFIGRNGSNGYQHGSVYNLEVVGATVRAFNRPDVTFPDIAEFLRTWTTIKLQ
jgi:hypothetical protein